MKNGSRSLQSKQAKRDWIAEHAEEMARAHNRGLSNSQISTKFNTSDYFVYVALYLTGDYVLPACYASTIKKHYGGLKSGFVRRQISIHHIKQEHHTPTKEERLQMTTCALENADKILTDKNAGMSDRALREKYNLSSYFIDGALYHRGVKTTRRCSNYANWPKLPTLATPNAWKDHLPQPKDFAKRQEVQEEESVIIMRYETTQLKQLRAALEKKQSPDPQMKAENEKLKADVETWMKEYEKMEKLKIEAETKYKELLKDVNENIAARVAADDAQAHKG